MAHGLCTREETEANTRTPASNTQSRASMSAADAIAVTPGIVPAKPRSPMMLASTGTAVTDSAMPMKRMNDTGGIFDSPMAR